MLSGALVVGCSSGRETSAAGGEPTDGGAVVDSAAMIVAASQRALGTSDALAAIQQVDFLAEAVGPNGSFTVAMKSARDGRARLTFDGAAVFVIDVDRAWRTGAEATEIIELTSAERSFVRGHELLIAAVDPADRWPELAVAEPTTFEARPALHLTGVDELGGEFHAYYSAADTLLLGFTIEDHLRGAGPVTVSLSDWRPVDGVLLPHAATFVQGDERFDYTMTEVLVHPVVDSALAVPAAPAAGSRPPDA